MAGKANPQAKWQFAGVPIVEDDTGSTRNHINLKVGSGNRAGVTHLTQQGAVERLAALLFPS